MTTFNVFCTPAVFITGRWITVFNYVVQNNSVWSGKEADLSVYRNSSNDISVTNLSKELLSIYNHSTKEKL